MIEKILWTEIGIGQPVDMAKAIAAHGHGFVVIAPVALHRHWQLELERAGIKPGVGTVMSPHEVHARGVSDGTMIVVDDYQYKQGWKLIAGQIRDAQGPVWLRVLPEIYREVQGALLPSPEKTGETADAIAKTVETVLRAHDIDPDHSWDAIVIGIFTQYPALAKWLHTVGERWEIARNVVPKDELLSVIESSEKLQIVFYRRREDVEDIPGEYMKGVDVAEANRLIERFAAREFKTLLVPMGRVTGWRAPLWEDEVDIRFVGTGWESAEIKQGKNRVKPMCFRELPEEPESTDEENTGPRP